MPGVCSKWTSLITWTQHSAQGEDGGWHVHDEQKWVPLSPLRSLWFRFSFSIFSPFFFFKRRFQPLPLPLFKHTGWQWRTDPFLKGSHRCLKKNKKKQLITWSKSTLLPSAGLASMWLVELTRTRHWYEGQEPSLWVGCCDLITSILRESPHSGRRGHGTRRLLTNNP